VPPLQTTMLSAHNSDNTLTATLQAFERYGVSRILAEPTVSAVSGESAKLTVGGEIPIPGPSQDAPAAAPSSSLMASPCGFPQWFCPRAGYCFISQRK
jgi:type II secretory pathway component HofQ